MYNSQLLKTQIVDLVDSLPEDVLQLLSDVSAFKLEVTPEESNAQLRFNLV